MVPRIWRRFSANLRRFVLAFYSPSAKNGKSVWRQFFPPFDFKTMFFFPKQKRKNNRTMTQVLQIIPLQTNVDVENPEIAEFFFLGKPWKAIGSPHVFLGLAHNTSHFCWLNIHFSCSKSNFLNEIYKRPILNGEFYEFTPQNITKTPVHRSHLEVDRALGPRWKRRPHLQRGFEGMEQKGHKRRGLQRKDTIRVVCLGMAIYIYICIYIYIINWTNNI